MIAPAIALLSLVSPPAHASSNDVPCLRGPMSRVFIPRNGRYLNDHTLVRDPAGLWHLFSIANTGPGDSFTEKSLLHATARGLAGPWTEQPDALAADPDALNELVTWAPHVLEWVPGSFVMFYWGEWVRPENLQRGIRRADSSDLFHWTKLETASDPTLRPPGGRDPMLLRAGDQWLLYSVGVGAGNHGQIVVTRNADLSDPHDWSDPVAVIEDPVPNFPWGNLESPFVVEHGGSYYLFLTRTGPHDPDVPAEYLTELAFRSDDPMHFEWKPVARFTAHAAEVVQDQGRAYLTSAGWTGVIGEASRGLKIAPLGWCRQR